MAHPTHAFVSDGDDYGRCMFCDCRPFGIWANVPCGSEEPQKDALSFPEIIEAMKARAHVGA